jgi:general secretion pathway protein A
MYNSYFGLKRNPFVMTPDPEFLFMTSQHREALAGLSYAILNRKGLGVLTGDAGTGKTTLLARTLQTLSQGQIRSSIVFHPTLTPDDFLEAAMLDFGLHEIPASKTQRLFRLQEFLVGAHQSGFICALIVDEAHKLSHELLEEIRLLGNFDYADQKLLQILLVGQTELDEILNRQDLRQLKQRIAVRLAIKPLQPSDVSQYIRFRWIKAGGLEQAPFTAAAIEEIGRISGGLPRVINTLCDNALMLAFAEQSRNVEVNMVREASADLQLLVITSPAAVNGNGTQAALSAPAWDAEPAAVAVPAPIRVPDFGMPNGNGHGSILTRWARKLSNWGNSEA